MPSTSIPIADFERQGRVFVVAEIAQAHDGSLGILHSFIDACAGSGVDAVKFQIHIAEAESSDAEPFRVAFSFADATRSDYWRRTGFTPEQWSGVKAHCESARVEFLATPFSNAAVDLLERLGVARYKIGSADVTNGLLVERIAKTGKEVILSSGLATFKEIERVVDRLRPQGVAVLQCTTRYPTEANDVGLTAIGLLRERLRCPAGLSDHSAKIYAGIAAAALGASVVEVHATFDRKMFGPDSAASLTIGDLAQMVDGIRFVEKARSGEPGKTLTPDVVRLREIFGRSLAVNRDLEANHVIAIDDLEGKKPAGMGIPIERFAAIVGRRLTCKKARWDFLREEDLA